MKDLKIGQAASATGLSTKTIRYYELLGLLRKPVRTYSGYRTYHESDLERLRFIKKAKGLGLSLTEIKDILFLHNQEQRPCVHVMALLDRKLAEIDMVLGNSSHSGLTWHGFVKNQQSALKVPPITQTSAALSKREFISRGSRPWPGWRAATK